MKSIDSKKTASAHPLVTGAAKATAKRAKRTTAATPGTATPPAVPPTAPAPSGGPPTIAPPPPAATIPSVPVGFVPKAGARHGQVLPRTAEAVALPGGVTDLAAFTNYTQTFGANAPPYSELLQLLDVGNAWTQMRMHTQAWQTYVLTQETIAWTAIRTQLALLVPMFKVAAVQNPSLLTQFPSLATLLTAREAAAKKATATKAANKKALAAGLPATHGTVGKTRQQRAAKALLAAANASGSSTAHAPTPVTPVVGTAGAGSQPPLHS